jgi:hypothetical protein
VLVNRLIQVVQDVEGGGGYKAAATVNRVGPVCRIDDDTAAGVDFEFDGDAKDVVEVVRIAEAVTIAEVGDDVFDLRVIGVNDGYFFVAEPGSIGAFGNDRRVLLRPKGIRHSVVGRMADHHPACSGFRDRLARLGEVEVAEGIH